jgi:hypothetical protein
MSTQLTYLVFALAALASAVTGAAVLLGKLPGRKHSVTTVTGGLTISGWMRSMHIQKNDGRGLQERVEMNWK